MGTEANKCSGCKKFPMVVASGTVMCPRCRVTSTTTKDWNKFMKPVNIDFLISQLERPIGVLKAVAVMTDDKGLKGLAATTLKSIGELEFSECFNDQAEATRYQKELDRIVGDL
jgi:RNA polymerase subunit RPABC4/transcription elongation factor Spt4